MDRIRRRERGIRWGAVTSVGSSASIALCSLFSTAMSLNYLGKELYGVWAIITSFFVWLQFFDFGLLSGLTNALSEAFGRDDYDAARSYISTSFCVSALISGLGIPAWIAFSLHAPWNGWIQSEHALLIGKGICLMGVLFFLTLPFLIANRILQAYQKTYILNVLVLVGYLLSFAVLCLGIQLQLSFLTLLISVCGIPYLCAAGVWVYLIRKMPWARVSWKHVNLASLKRVGSSSFPLLAYQVINLGLVQMIPILLASKISLRNVADFSLLWKIYQFLLIMVANLSVASQAAVREAYERGEKQWIASSGRRLLLLQGAMTMLCTLPLLLGGNQLITLWTSMPLEHPLHWYEWGIFSLCLLFAVLKTTLAAWLNALEKIIPQCLLSLFTCFLLIGALQAAVPDFGLMAIFATLLLAYFVSCVFSLNGLRKMI
jgi:O-antigen/teichoic acid export membrane protein